MRRIGVLIALGIAVGVVVAVTVNAFVVTVARVESDSMSPTLHTGDVVALGRMGDPNRFDVVGFDGRGSFLPLSHDRVVFVKRVIGLPGDRITCCDEEGRLLVNGNPVDEEYLGGEPPSDVAFDVLVPPRKMWVMGDNRSQSTDSRAYLGAPGGGFVPLERIEGVVVGIVAPPGEIQWWGSGSVPTSGSGS